MTTIVPMRRRRMWPAFGPAPFRSLEGFTQPRPMPTDIEKTDEGLEFAVSLPGYEKDNVEVELKDGYLSISASTQSCEEKTEEESDSTYIRKERFMGSCKRAFYVGEDIREDEITAKFEGGVLKVSVPFEKPEEKPEEKKLIAIEG